MPFLGLGYSPPTPAQALIQHNRIARARATAAATPKFDVSARRLAIQNARIAKARQSAGRIPRKSTMLGSMVDEMSGLGYSPDSAVEALVQADRIALARTSAEATPKKTTLLGSLVDELSGLLGLREELGHEDERDENFPGLTGLGVIASPYRQGTKNWWQWYATVYLPQYYSQQQIQQYVVQSPYYQYFGSPFGYSVTPNYQQPYQAPYYGQYGYQQPINYGYGSTGYPSYNQYGQLIDPYSQAQYTQYVGEQGSAQCAAQGGYYDYVQQTCGYAQGYPYGGTSYGTTQSYGPGSTPPNVVGMPEGQAIQALNSTGFNVWELNVNGQSRGVPPGYSQNRVSISVQNGIVTAAAVG